MNVIPTIAGRRVRVATYNVHKCQGLDRRVLPERIVEVLHELDADVVALQEVLGHPGGSPEEDHARYIAGQLGMRLAFGETRKHGGRAYGNALLSRFPLRSVFHHDLTAQGREPRGCLHAVLELPNGVGLHIFNLHLGTSFRERRHQARKLIDAEILTPPERRGPRIVLGDFNEWTRGLTTRLLHAHFVSADVRGHLKRSRTYPGVLPLLHLDHIYFDSELRLERLVLHRNRRSLLASDHLPLLADFLLASPLTKAPAA